MNTIWTGIHRCDCGWSGATPQQQWIQRLGFVMIFGGIGLVLGDGLEWWDLARWIQWPVLLAVFGLWYGVPALFKHFNGCPSCKQPLKFKLHPPE